MIICACVCFFSGVGLFVVRKREKWKKMRNPCLVLALFSILGILLEGLDGKATDFTGQGWISRKEPGEGELETEVLIQVPELETEYAYTFTIPEKVWSRSEQEKLIEAAKAEIEETFPGNNASLEAIVENPKVYSTYQQGSVKAEWEFSDSDCISYDGTIDPKVLGNQGRIVEASVSLSCGTYQEVYQFCFQILPVKKNVKERIGEDIERQIAMQEETEEKVKLPQQADGYKIRWSGSKEYAAIQLLGVGFLAAAAELYIQKEQEERKKQKRKARLLLEYPEFVSKFSLLLGSGMTISAAFRKMNQMHQRQEKARKRSPVYEELHRMICEIENGAGEFRAYQKFGERCDLQPYRKLVSLILSSQQMGNRKLTEQLFEEADRVFLERKNTARKLGEEAGTKLMFPMMLMLAVIMAIILIPAFLSVGGM